MEVIMTNGDKVRQMSDEELVEFIESDRVCSESDDCTYCSECLLKYLKSSASDTLMESKRDGFFECDMRYCMFNVKGRCTNCCYLDCQYYSLRNSLRELVNKYEEIVTRL